MDYGKFITFEGPDASGKSTQVGFFVQLLRERGYRVVQSREPGGTPLGEDLRKLLLFTKMDRLTEMLLFATIRAENVAQVIKPALLRGDVVVCERFSDSSYAYQGKARNNIQKVLELERFVLEGFEPDYTLFFDITELESERRLRDRSQTIKLDEFEKEAAQFRKDVYNGYQDRRKSNQHRMHVINSMVPINEVQETLIRWVDEIFVPNNPLPG